MRLIARFASVVLILSAVTAVNGASPAQQQDGKPIYRHAYYLFPTGTPGCDGCYGSVPLLITAESLEKLAKSSSKANCVLITTYERDSVFINDGLVEIAPGDIKAPPRFIHFRGGNYRYQEITTAEAINLLENPLGTISIARPDIPGPGWHGPSLASLASDLRRAH